MTFCKTSSSNFFPHRLMERKIVFWLMLSYLLQSCVSQQSSLQFIQNNAQRVIENKALRRTFKKADLAVILERFHKPEPSDTTFRLATVLLLARSREDVQLEYFEVIIYALSDPSPQVQLAAIELLETKQNHFQWLRKISRYAIFQESQQTLENQSDEGLQFSLLKGASILNLPLSREKVALFVDQYSFYRNLHPYLANLILSSYDSISSEFLSSTLDDASFYRSLSQGPLEQRLLLLQCLEKVAPLREELFPTVFHFLHGEALPVAQEAARILTNWPGQQVSTFLLELLEQSQKSWKPYELDLFFFILSKRDKFEELWPQLLQLYYKETENQAIYIEFFRGLEAASFGKIFINSLPQNAQQAGLQLFEQVTQNQQLEILRNYFFAELDTSYRTLLPSFLSKAVSIGSIMDPLLLDFFNRNSYDFYRSHLNGDTIMLTTFVYNLEALLRILPEAKLSALIDWDSLNYFESDKALQQENPKQLLQQRALRREALQNVDERLLFQGQLPENQGFLNWLKIYCSILFRNLKSYRWKTILGEQLAILPQEERLSPLGESLPPEAVPSISLQEISQDGLESDRLKSAPLFEQAQVKDQIALATRLIDNYRLWLARAKYFEAQKSNAVSTYNEYVANMVNLNRQIGKLELEIQNQFLQNDQSNLRDGSETWKNLLQNLADVEQRKLRLRDRFEQSKQPFSASRIKSVATLWLQHLQQAYTLQKAWQAADGTVKFWFRHFFPSFEIQYMQDLTHFLLQNQ